MRSEAICETVTVQTDICNSSPLSISNQPILSHPSQKLKISHNKLIIPHKPTASVKPFQFTNVTDALNDDVNTISSTETTLTLNSVVGTDDLSPSNQLQLNDSTSSSNSSALSLDRPLKKKKRKHAGDHVSILRLFLEKLIGGCGGNK